MYLELDFGFLSEFLALSPDQMALQLFFWGGWIPVAITFLWAAKELWLYYIGGKWFSEQKFLLLAVDVPTGNDVPLRSVENMFTYFAGAHGTFSLVDKYWIGKFQLGFSFEIVSIDGYTQFLIWTPAHFRNLVESGIYSVYPGAEISEVNDYTDNVPNNFPDSEWDLWGSEVEFVNNHMYPFKTYPEFEDTSSPTETTFKDPMASLMDLNSSLRPGEQLWIQILAVPADFGWEKEADAEIGKIMGEKASSNKDIIDNTADLVKGLIVEPLIIIKDSILSLFGVEPAPAVEEAEPAPKTMVELRPREKKKLEALEKKASKLGFMSKIRVVYIARKEVKNVPKAISGFFGYMKQFHDTDINNFKPDTANTSTSVSYFNVAKRQAERQNNIMAGYKYRSGSRGRLMKIMNIEELATLWHFPIDAVVKAPLIQKASGRKADPPMTLPVHDEDSSIAPGASGSGMSSIFEEEVLRDSEEARVKADSSGSDVAEESTFESRDQAKNTSLPDFFEEEDEEKEEKQTGEVPGNLPFV